MSNKTPAIISTILTILLIIGLVMVSLLFEMVALNGVSERQGMTAMGISVVCQGIGVILLGIFAWWATNRMIGNFNWNKTLAVILAVLLATLAGGVISFLSIVIAIPVAGIR